MPVKREQKIRMKTEQNKQQILFNILDKRQNDKL